MTKIRKMYWLGGSIGLIAGLLVYLNMTSIFDNFLVNHLDFGTLLYYGLSYEAYKELGIFSYVGAMFCGVMAGLILVSLYLVIRNKKL